MNALFVWPSHTSQSQSEIVADPVFKWQGVEKREYKKRSKTTTGSMNSLLSHKAEGGLRGAEWRQLVTKEAVNFLRPDEA